MELLQLRYFSTVAQYESITKAAQHYNIPQPSMSQTIRRLEKDLGEIKLFDRMNGKVYLNEQGKLFYKYVTTALQALDDGIQCLQNTNNKPAGEIHVLVMENRRFVLNCISQFSKIYPEVTFFVSHDFYSEQHSACDLCVSSYQTYQHMRSSHPLIQEKIVLAVHETNPFASRPVISLSELQEEKFITMPVRSSQYAITYDRCRRSGFEPRVHFICDDPYFVRKYISENMGVALAPSVSWAGRFRKNTKLIPFDDSQMITTSYLIWNEDRYITPAVSKFRDFLLQESRSIPGNLLYDTDTFM